MHTRWPVGIVAKMTGDGAAREPWPRRRTFLAERYSGRISPQTARRESEAARVAAIQLSLEGRTVTLLGSLLVPSDETAFSLFGAATVEDVAAVGERAALPYDRITESLVVPIGSAMRHVGRNGAPRSLLPVGKVPATTPAARPSTSGTSGPR